MVVGDALGVFGLGVGSGGFRFWGAGCGGLSLKIWVGGFGVLSFGFGFGLVDLCFRVCVWVCWV